MPMYLGIAFGFLVALAGLVFIFLEVRTGGLVVSEGQIAPSTGDLDHAVNQLAKNYDILRRQATHGFLLAGTFMAMGIMTILVGSVGDLFGLTSESSDLTIVAGVIVELISGAGLYLFRQTFNRLNSTSDRLHETWRILAAFRKAEALPEERRSEVVERLIFMLVDGGRESEHATVAAE